MHRFLEDEVQEIRVFYTRFVSTLRYEPTEAVMLPLMPAQSDAGASKSGDYLYEPSAEAVLAALLPKSVRNRVFNAIAEAATSEHGARMTSMGAATDNAGNEENVPASPDDTTVEQSADTTRGAVDSRPGRPPITFPTSSVHTRFRPAPLSSSAMRSPLRSSENDGAGISESSI